MVVFMAVFHTLLLAVARMTLAPCLPEFIWNLHPQHHSMQ